MKHLKTLLVLAVAAVLLLGCAVSASALSPVSSEPESAVSNEFVDSDVVVEQAPPDYSIWVFVIIGLAVGGLVLYVLVKPKKY